MPKIANFVYCLDVESNKGSKEAYNGNYKINAVGVFSTMTLAFIPIAFTFSIVFSILGVDKSKDNILRVLFKFKDETITDSGDIKFSASHTEYTDAFTDDSKNNDGFTLSMDFRNTIFKTEGEYHTEIYLNNEIVDDKPIYVTKRQESQ